MGAMDLTLTINLTVEHTGDKYVPQDKLVEELIDRLIQADPKTLAQGAYKVTLWDVDEA
jgi:hypothetical protein